VRCPEGFDGKVYGELTHHFLETYNAVCLGLFRLCFDGSDDGPRFVITNPAQDMQLRETDWFFVLGNAKFGQVCYTRKILVGAESAPAAVDPDGEDFRKLDFEEDEDNDANDDPVVDDDRDDPVALIDDDIWASACSIHADAGEAALPQRRTSREDTYVANTVEVLLSSRGEPSRN